MLFGDIFLLHTTTAHFELFKKVALQWIDNWGLNAWDIKFKHESTPENRLAWIAYSIPGGWCTFYLNVEWDEESPSTGMERQKVSINK